MGLRGDAIVQFDYCVGEILNTLEKLGLRENTLIILSSDNGPVVDDGYDDKAEELLNGHSPAGPLRGNKYSAFEGGTRIPAIVSWPAGVVFIYTLFYSPNRSGRSFLVRSRDCCSSHSLIFASCPDNRISGTFQPL